MQAAEGKESWQSAKREVAGRKIVEAAMPQASSRKRHAGGKQEQNAAPSLQCRQNAHSRRSRLQRQGARCPYPRRASVVVEQARTQAQVERCRGAENIHRAQVAAKAQRAARISEAAASSLQAAKRQAVEKKKKKKKQVSPKELPAPHSQGKGRGCLTDRCE